MKIVFAGPSIHGLDKGPLGSCSIRPPAACGDVLHAVQDGAETIGLIDGVFESVPSVWHKEILFALAAGVRVLGAASIGALRAAECHAFGMEGIGTIFEQYRSGERVCDADVALTHAPSELGYAPLTEALVDIEPTISRLVSGGWLEPEEAAAMLENARRLHFKKRTWDVLMDKAGFGAKRRSTMLLATRGFRPTQKQRDASEMIEAMSRPPGQQDSCVEFQFSRTIFFDRLRQRTSLKDRDQW